jgi:hypothetical protein
MLHTIIGYCGLALLMIAVLLHKKQQRLMWLLSSILLTVYSVFLHDNVFIFVNVWVSLVNLYFLVKQDKKISNVVEAIKDEAATEASADELSA